VIKYISRVSFFAPACAPYYGSRENCHPAVDVLCFARCNCFSNSSTPRKIADRACEWSLVLIYEYVGNPHTHTLFSDGEGSHEEIAQAALQTDLDFVFVTDHNVYVSGLDGYRYQGEKRVLLLVGEEIHDQQRDPQKNHLLAFEARQEMAHLAHDTQNLIDQIRLAKGTAFLAHPVDPDAPLINNDDLSWVDWDIDGYAGLEIWNFMSEFKGLLSTFRKALGYINHPERIGRGPFPAALARWDEMLAKGKRVAIIGGADAHATTVVHGPLKRVVFPYEFLFRTVNTHLLTTKPLNGKVAHDRRLLHESMRKGRCFVGYDLPAPTRGFRFTAETDAGRVQMGETATAHIGVTLQVRLPRRAEIRLLHNGEELKVWQHAEAAVHLVKQPGAYRVEVYLLFEGERRTWILSNPIYVM